MEKQINEYIEKVRKLNINQNSQKPKTMFISTFGCQMNSHDSEKLAGMLSDMGYVQAQAEKEADIIVYNTCCVRENAENKVYGNLGYLKNLKQKKKDLKIVVCGCMVQQNTAVQKIRQSYKNVDIIFGTFNMHRFPELLYTSLTTNSFIMDIWENHGEIVEDLPAIREFKHKASVNVMFGCNNFCSYCIVPYVRGRERSRKPSDIIQEIKDLVADGVVEVTLLGQNVNSYGKDLTSDTNFAMLIREVDNIDGLMRVRFVTSHPKDLSEDLIEAIRDCEKVCKHLHLPFQSGSNKILAKMNRKYTREHYISLINKIKTQIPNIAVTTDIIVGFPGETEEDFLDTLNLVKQVHFSSAFTFLYSKRTGTPAETMEEQVAEHIAKERFNRLLDVLNEGIYKYNLQFLGKTVKVLAEEINSQDNSLITGRTEQNTIVHFKGNASAIGKIIDVEITECKTFYLIGNAK